MSPYLIIGALLAVIASFFFGWHVGADQEDGKFAAAAAKQEQQVVTTVETQAAETSKVSEQAAEHTQQIQTITQTIIKEVPKYVTVKANAHCVIPYGAVRVLDAAARGVPLVPSPAGQSNDVSSGASLDTVVGDVAADLGTARQIRQQLIDLQGWVKAQKTPGGATSGD